MPERLNAPVAIIGRLLLSAIFLASPILNLIPNFDSIVMALQQTGMPLPTASLVIGIIMLLAGSISLILGYKARTGALLLLLFLLPATLLFHAPWKAADAAEASQQMIHFLKNIGLMGAMLIVIVLGPGPGSLEGERS